jgi:glycosyltransferase involved in cell wall biosynthesis
MAPDVRAEGSQAAPIATSRRSPRPANTPVAAIILTRNEAENLPHALASVMGWAAEVWVVDAGSTDQTVEVARAAGAAVTIHPFEGFAAQRNWALRSLPFRQEWVLFLDADEALTPELRAELTEVLSAGHDGAHAGDGDTAAHAPAACPDAPGEVAGYYVKRRFIFLGRWLRHGGYYPVWLLRVVRHRLARCEDRGVDEHLVVDGATARLRHDLVHEDRRPLSRWIERHARYAQLAAADLARDARADGIAPRLRGAPAERSRWWYERVYRRTPLGLRALAYFAYRYVLRGGFLDGREGLIYHVLQALWYRILIDAHVLEARRRAGVMETRVSAPEPAPRPPSAPSSTAGSR